jgi:hypothetical protein
MDLPNGRLLYGFLIDNGSENNKKQFVKEV